MVGGDTCVNRQHRLMLHGHMCNCALYFATGRLRRSKPTIYNNVDMKATIMFENGIFGVWFIGIRVMIIIIHMYA